MGIQDNGAEEMSKMIMPDILNGTWEDSAGIMRGFRRTQYCEKVLDVFATLRTEELYQSSLHGQGHIERVILLGAILAWKESLQDLETAMLIAACAYHDIGRIDDGVDREHGLRSAQKMQSLGLMDDFKEIPAKYRPIIYAAVASHCIKAMDRPKMLQMFGVEDIQIARFLTVSNLLNSADRLDRVRLGDLDPEYLRSSAARGLVEFAEELYSEYSRRSVKQD